MAGQTLITLITFIYLFNFNIKKVALKFGYLDFNTERKILKIVNSLMY